MKALVKFKTGKDNMRISDVPQPVPGKGQVKIKVMAAGVCGTDLLIWLGKHKVSTPLIPGHEIAGIVAELGEGVEGIAVGDRVTTETTFQTCEICDYCMTKEYNICGHRKGLGTHVDGGFAEYVVSRQESIHLLPDNVDFLSAALTEPLACGVHAVMEKSKVNPGDFAVVFGPGAIGLLVAQVAKAVGARVAIVGISKDETRLNLASKIGIDWAINSREQSLTDFVNGITLGKGADIIYECSGSPQAVNVGMEIIKTKGQFVQMGLFLDPHITINADYLVHRELNIIGSRSQKPSSWVKALRLLTDGKVNTRALVKDTYPLEDWENAFSNSQNGKDVKAVIYPNGSPKV